MNLILLVLIAIGSTFGNETTQKKEYCFLSQHAWHDSFSTADVLLRHKSKIDPQAAVWRDQKSAYKVILDPELRMCFSFQAYPLDITKIDKYVTEFKMKYKESEINISERHRKKIVPLKLSPDDISADFKQLWQLNPHLNLSFDPIKNKQINLRFAKHVHVAEGAEKNVYHFETLKKNRFLSADVLHIRAFYLHERLIR